MKRAMSLSPANSTPASRNSSEMAEARPPFIDEMLAVFFDDAADFIEFMLLEAFISAQCNWLQPELTRTAPFFNMNVRRFKFIGEVKMEPEAMLAQDCGHMSLQGEAGSR